MLASSSLCVSGLSKAPGSPWSCSSSGVCRSPFFKSFEGLRYFQKYLTWFVLTGAANWARILAKTLASPQSSLCQAFPAAPTMDRGAWWLLSRRWQRVGHDWAPYTFTFTTASHMANATCVFWASPSKWGVLCLQPCQLGVPQLTAWLQGLSEVTQAVMVSSPQSTVYAYSQSGQPGCVPPPAAEPDPTSPLGSWSGWVYPHSSRYPLLGWVLT